MTELVFINQIFPFNDSLMLILKGNVIISGGSKDCFSNVCTHSHTPQRLRYALRTPHTILENHRPSCTELLQTPSRAFCAQGGKLRRNNDLRISTLGIEASPTCARDSACGKGLPLCYWQQMKLHLAGMWWPLWWAISPAGRWMITSSISGEKTEAEVRGHGQGHWGHPAVGPGPQNNF